MDKLQPVLRCQCATHVGPLSPCERWHYVHSTGFLIFRTYGTKAKQRYFESG
jgi:hypothetical protein